MLQQFTCRDKYSMKQDIYISKLRDQQTVFKQELTKDSRIHKYTTLI